MSPKYLTPLSRFFLLVCLLFHCRYHAHGSTEPTLRKADNLKEITQKEIDPIEHANSPETEYVSRLEKNGSLKRNIPPEGKNNKSLEPQQSEEHSEEEQVRKELDFLNEQIKNVPNEQELRVLLSKRDALSAKIKWIHLRKALKTFLPELIERKEKLDMTEEILTQDLDPKEKELLLSEADLRRAEVVYQEALIKKLQAEIHLGLLAWQLAETQSEEVQATANIEQKEATLKQTKPGEKAEKFSDDGSLPAQTATKGKKPRGKHPKLNKVQLEQDLKEARHQLEEIQRDVAEKKQAFADEEAVLHQLEQQVQTERAQMEEKKAQYGKRKNNFEHQAPHLFWAGASGFGADVGIISWPTHFLSEQNGLNGLLTSLGATWNQFFKYKGRYICRLGVSFLLGGDFSHKSFLLGGIGNIDIIYPIIDWFSIGMNLHGGYLTALGGSVEDTVGGAVSLGNRGYGLAGASAFARFHVSSSIDLSVFLGGTGFLGPERSGSLMIGARINIGLPRLEIEEQKSRSKPEQPS